MPPSFIERRAGCAALSLCLAGCASFQEPPPRPLTTLDVAFLATPGDEHGAKVRTIDGVPLDTGNGPIGVRPRGEPPGMNSTIGVWLQPGRHVVRAQYVRNIEGGMSLAQGEVALTLRAGHTYMVHPVVASDFATVNFTLADYGAAFPFECLPSALATPLQLPNGRVTRVRITQADVVACRNRSVSPTAGQQNR